MKQRIRLITYALATLCVILAIGFIVQTRRASDFERLSAHLLNHNWVSYDHSIAKELLKENSDRQKVMELLALQFEEDMNLAYQLYSESIPWGWSDVYPVYFRRSYELLTAPEIQEQRDKRYPYAPPEIWSNRKKSTMRELERHHRDFLAFKEGEQGRQL